MIELTKLTTMQLREILEKEKQVVGVLPLGSIEQHGPHLPLGTDYLGAEVICRLLCEQCRAILLPAIPFGVSFHHADWPGTISISSETLLKLLMELTESLILHGLKRFLWINHHGGNIPTLQLARQQIALSHEGVQIVIPEPPYSILKRRYEDLDIHAGHSETDFVLTLLPELVDRSALKHLEPSKDLQPHIKSLLGTPSDSIKRSLLDACLPARTKRITQTGVISTLDPRKAVGQSAEFIEKWIIHLQSLLEEWDKIPPA